MSVAAIHKATTADLRRDLVQGSFHAVERSDGTMAGFQFICPCGCGNESWLPFGTAEGGWTFDRNLEAPTLWPSVNNTGMPCGWHGWLRNGQWVLA